MVVNSDGGKSGLRHISVDPATGKSEDVTDEWRKLSEFEVAKMKSSGLEVRFIQEKIERLKAELKIAEYELKESQAVSGQTLRDIGVLSSKDVKVVGGTHYVRSGKKADGNSSKEK